MVNLNRSYHNRSLKERGFFSREHYFQFLSSKYNYKLDNITVMGTIFGETEDFRNLIPAIKAAKVKNIIFNIEIIEFCLYTTNKNFENLEKYRSNDDSCSDLKILSLSEVIGIL